jgi:hypothetical protein
MRQYLFPIIAFTLVSVLFVVVEISRPKEVDWKESYSLDDKNPFGAYLLFERLQDFNGNKPIIVSEKSIFEELENRSGNLSISSKKYYSNLENNEEYISYYEPDEQTVDSTIKSQNDTTIIKSDSTNTSLDTVKVKRSISKKPLLFVDTNLTTRCDVCTTYFFVNGTVAPDRYETEMLMKFVAEGNTVVLIAENFGKYVYDSVQIFTRDHFENNLFTDSTRPKTHISFYPRFSNKSDSKFYITEKRIAFEKYIRSNDSLFTTVIASKSDSLPIGAKVQYGRGQFLFFTTPKLFTNYGIIKPETNQLVTALLSILPNNTILWNDYYKFNATNVSRSPLRYILSQEALRWAYYMFLFVSLVYITFAMKRTQRPIPIVKPVSNDTVDFVNTIGTLFFQSKEHRIIALKKIQYFFDFLRTTYYINTSKFDKEFFEKASLKLQLPMDETISLFSKINGVLESDTIDEEEMKQLVLQIDKLIAQGQGTKKATV